MALALGILALGVLTEGITSRINAADSSSSTGKVRVIYQKKRAFRIPFHINAEAQARIKEVQLWVSEDSGFHWEPKSRTTPDLGKFTFRTSHDGEFWFATRTVTVDGEYSPPMSHTVEPSMKVVVDTVPPSLVLEPDGRRGSRAAVRWEAKDEHLDLKTLVLEYQVEGAREWRRVPVQRPALIGAQSWDAGTADSLRVRAYVADKAGNEADAEIVMGEGTAGLPDVTTIDPESSAPPIDRISGHGGSLIAEGPGFPPVQESPSLDPGPPARPGPRRAFAKRTRVDGSASAGSFPAAPDRDRGSGGQSGGFTGEVSMPATASPAAAVPPFTNPFPLDDRARSTADLGSGGTVPATVTDPNSSRDGSPSPGNRTILAPRPRFKVQYAVEDAGPNGPATVELWITQDGGRTWIRRGEDPDKISPLEVDLGGEGTFGITLVARSASGLGDQPPAPGDPPQTWVEVDSTPPTVQLYPPQIGTGPHAGKVAIGWRASDLHLAARSVSLLWRPDQPGAAWQPIVTDQESVGQYIWTVPPSFPARFHIRVEAIDSLGHRGAAETPDGSPIIVDRSRPRSRIIGLDPNARAGDGPSARPLR
jgi:hypothetical protein